MPESISEKVAHVKGATQDREHVCHWPGCGKQVPPAMWGCTAHWYALPQSIRNRIWRSYRVGQETNRTPSRLYIEAAREAQEWIASQVPDPSLRRTTRPLDM